MSYRIDWVQFFAALVALASYGATIAAMFAFYIPWPVTVPAHDRDRRRRWRPGCTAAT